MDAAIKEAGGVPLGKSRGRMLQAEKGIYKGLGTGFRGGDTGQGDRAEVKRAGSRPVAQRGLQCRVLTPGEGAGLGERMQAEDTVPGEVCTDLRERGEGGQCDAEGTNRGRGRTGFSRAQRAGCSVAEAEVEEDRRHCVWAPAGSPSVKRNKKQHRAFLILLCILALLQVTLTKLLIGNLSKFSQVSPCYTA